MSAPSEEKVMPPSELTEERMKRPLGLTIISILWLIGGLWNLYVSYNTISMGIELFSYLNVLPEWYKLGMPIEITIYSLIFVLALMQFVTIYGLWTGKSWSYKFALIIPIIVAIAAWAELILLVSAPASLGISYYEYILPAIVSIFWVAVYWTYLRQPHVKKYLKI